MSPKSILLVQKSVSSQRLKQVIDSGGAVVTVETTERAQRRIGKKPYALIVIEGREDWYKEIQRLRRFNGMLQNTMIFIAPSSILNNHPDCLKVLSTVALGSVSSVTQSELQGKIQEELTLKDFVDRKLSGFVRHMKNGGVRNLYSMMIAEVERPLITQTLKESNGNQVRAARLLGMNRNTLRKKIKDLKIHIKEPAKIRKKR